MTPPRVDAGQCAEALVRETLDLRVAVTGVKERSPPTGPRGLGRVRFYVKTLNPSVDEVPVIAAAARASLAAGVGLEFYEYEGLGGGRDRYATLARLLADAFARGRPFLALIPRLMVVRLLSTIEGAGLEERLEESVLAEVEVAKEDVLYTPALHPPGGVEVVVKESSAAGEERARILEGLLRASGARVRGVVRLPDNNAIAEYVLEHGLCSAMARVPVTRLARLLASLYKCTGLTRLVEAHRVGGPGGPEDSGGLTLYAYRVPSPLAEGLVEELEKAASSGWMRVRDHLAPGGVGAGLEASIRRRAVAEVEAVLSRWWCTG